MTLTPHGVGFTHLFDGRVVEDLKDRYIEFCPRFFYVCIRTIF